MQVKAAILAVGISTVVAIALALCWHSCKHNGLRSALRCIGTFGEMHSDQVEGVNLPPFLSQQDIETTFMSFVDQDRSGTRKTLGYDYAYFFSICIGDSDYRVYLRRDGAIANENQNPSGAEDIRSLLLFAKGADWYRSKFTKEATKEE